MTLPLTQAFLEQAKADYSTYNIIRSHPNQPSSQWLHLLQMTLEKAAKAYLAAGGDNFDKLKESHRVFHRFIQMLPRNPNKRFRAELNMDPVVLRQHIKNLETLVYDIEQLIPGRDNQGPTAEYPWKNSAGGFYSPCSYGFQNLTFIINNTARGRNLFKILNNSLYNEIWHSAFGIN